MNFIPIISAVSYRVFSLIMRTHSSTVWSWSCLRIIFIDVVELFIMKSSVKQPNKLIVSI